MAIRVKCHEEDVDSVLSEYKSYRLVAVLRVNGSRYAEDRAGHVDSDDRELYFDQVLHYDRS